MPERLFVLPFDVVVDGDVMAVVVVVRLLRLDPAVASFHHHVAVLQDHLAHSVLPTHHSHR